MACLKCINISEFVATNYKKTFIKSRQTVANSEEMN